MTIRIATAAALLALAAPAAAADDSLDYNTLIDCAAYNQLLIVVFSANDGATKNKADIDEFKGRAAALMTIATVSSKSPAEKIQADAGAKRDAMFTSLTQEGAADTLLKEYAGRCDTMGRAAKLALDDAMAK